MQLPPVVPLAILLYIAWKKQSHKLAKKLRSLYKDKSQYRDEKACVA